MLIYTPFPALYECAGDGNAAVELLAPGLNFVAPFTIDRAHPEVTV